MKKIKLLLATSLAFLNYSYAQDNNNLVENPSFEEVAKKIKEEGQIGYAAPWSSATMNPVDLYSADAKNDELGVPENKYGKEKARTGNNYVGVSFYGYRGRRPRTYLQTKLKKPLEAGKSYCVKFFISLSDMSKYASNNISAHLSKEEVNEMNEANLKLEPHVQSITNKIYQQQFLWKPVCSTYEAEGGEQFLVIGNFKSDEETLTEKIRLSREFTGRQMYDAYYFIDDVSVIDTEKQNEDCMCDEIAGGQMEVEYKSFGSTPDKSANKTTLYNSDGTVGNKKEGEAKKEDAEEEVVSKVESAEEPAKAKPFSVATTSIFFDSKKSEPKPAEMKKLQKVADVLNNNAATKIVIVGHYDESESEVSFLGKRRALAIRKALEGLGIAEARMKLESDETGNPHPAGQSEKNQRVTFKIQ